MNQKGFTKIVLTLIAIALVGMVGYFMLLKKTASTTQQQITSPTKTQGPPSHYKATSTPITIPLLQTPLAEDTATEQFNGLLRSTSVNSWSLLMSSSKAISIHPLQFLRTSVCVIGPDEGPCSILQSNFNKGIYSPGGGDAVSISGNKGDDTIIVKKLILNENFVMNGHLTQDLSRAGQGNWNLVFQPPIGDSAGQSPSRPTDIIPLKFDVKSGCGDTGNIHCSSYTLHQNDFAFVRGLRYKGALIVRMLTVPATPPPSLPR